MCLGCWGSIMQLHYNIYLYMLRSCPHHHPHGESSTLSHLHFASSMFSWCCSTSCSHIPMLQGWKTSLQVFKLGFTNYYLLYIKNKVDKLEGKVPMKKGKWIFQIRNFLVSTKSFFDTKWKEKKKRTSVWEKWEIDILK